MKKNFSIFLLSALATTSVYADNNPVVEHGPLQDSRFESKGTFKMGQVPNDGILTTEYTGTLSDGKTDHAVNLRLESNIISDCREEKTGTSCVDGLTSSGPLERVNFASVQMTARLDLDHADKDPNFLINKFKFSVARLMFEHGISLEVVGYLNQFVQRAGSPYEGYRLQGIEIVDAKVFSEIETNSPNFQIQFSLRASFGIGLGKRDAIARTFEFEKEGKAAPAVINPDGYGSIGFRVYKRAIAAVFGGVDVYAARNRVGGRMSDRANSLHSYFGAQASYRVWEDKYDRALDLNATIQRDDYFGDLVPQAGSNTGITWTGGAAFHY